MKIYFKIKYSIVLLIFVLYSASCFFIGCRGKDNITRNESLVIVKGKYMGWACGDYAPQIYPTEGIDSSIKIDSKFMGFTFWVQENFKSPDTIEKLCVPENVFELKGYYYYMDKDGQRTLYHRFDLVDWRALAPYQCWNENGEKYLVNESQKFRKKIKEGNDVKSTFMKAQKYLIDCD